MTSNAVAITESNVSVQYSPEPYHELTDWLSSSGIQETVGEDQGGVYAWIDQTSMRPSFLYTEITGYFMTHVSNILSLSQNSTLLSQAESAARWVMHNALSSEGLFLTRKYPLVKSDDLFCFSRKRAVFFDNCMVGFGLYNLYRITANPTYLQAAIFLADSCIDHFCDHNYRLIHPVIDLSKKEFTGALDHWSAHCGSFNLKCGMLFNVLAKVTGDQRYTAVVDQLLSLALAARKSDGRFVTSLKSDHAHLHPMNYTIEGLLVIGAERKDEKLLDIATNAIDFAFKACLDPKSGLNHSEPAGESYCKAKFRSDALAQSLRAYFLACIILPGWGGRWASRIPHLLRELSRFRLPGGGTSYGYDRNSILIPHANAWCHFFRTEVELYRRHCASGSQIKDFNLVIT